MVTTRLRITESQKNAFEETAKFFFEKYVFIKQEDGIYTYEVTAATLSTLFYAGENVRTRQRLKELYNTKP